MWNGKRKKENPIAPLKGIIQKSIDNCALTKKRKKILSYLAIIPRRRKTPFFLFVFRESFICMIISFLSPSHILSTLVMLHHWGILTYAHGRMNKVIQSFTLQCHFPMCFGILSHSEWKWSFLFYFFLPFTFFWIIYTHRHTHQCERVKRMENRRKKILDICFLYSIESPQHIFHPAYIHIKHMFRQGDSCKSLAHKSKHVSSVGKGIVREGRKKRKLKRKFSVR